MQRRDMTFIVIAALIFTMLVDKYYLHGVLRLAVGSGVNKVVEKIDYLIATCDDGEVRINLPDSYLCRSTDVEPSRWLEIYDTYPKSLHGREAIFSFLSEGTLEDADLMLQGMYPVPRFEPVKLDTPLTWKENPYDERYWRFIFYSLRPTQHLVYAGMTTGKKEYNDALIEMIESFIDTGTDEVWAWDDYHSVAFRTMVFINAWWKLREQSALTPETSEKILRTLEQHGVWLMDEQHFESENNHGITEAAALFLLAQTFPDLPEAAEWDSLGRQRLESLLTLIVDEDGVQVENSPYYHFYSLEKFWDVYSYGKRYNMTRLTELFDEKMSTMTRYATYVLQPDLSVPLIGASLERYVRPIDVYTSIAATDPYLNYALTQGKSGKAPPATNVRFPVAGQTIMRSGWGKGKEYVNQTQVIFDYGTYRTSHSDLDALNFTLYSNGADLMVDSGLYTYEQNEYRRYFHGTAGHNTVVVDGQDQRPGSAVAGEFIEGDGYASQIASHALYPGVIHNRALALLGHDLVLVVDRLLSADEHDYSQTFHIAPGATVTVDGLTVTAQLNDPKKQNQRVTIHQLSDPGLKVNTVEGENSPPAGLCSPTYEHAVPCAQVSYQQRATTGTFITLIEIGEPDGLLAAEVSDDLTFITIQSSSRDYKVHLDWPDNAAVTPILSGTKGEATARYDMTLSLEDDDWVLTPSPSDTSAGGGEYILETMGDKLKIRAAGPEINRFDVTIEDLSTYSSWSAKAHTDLPTKPGLEGTFRIYEQEDYLPIFGYHYVIPDLQPLASSYEMNTGEFLRVVESATNAMGCQWYTLRDIVQNYILKEKKIPYRACVMTFDDGVRNQYENVLPILQDLGAVATFYVLPGQIGQSDRYMTWEQVDEIYRSGNEMGSHAVTSEDLIHDDLDELVYEIGDSKKLLDAHGYEVRTFAYPRGKYSDEIIGVVQQSGYTSGRATDKNHTWLDRRAQTVSMTDAHQWVMPYTRADVRSLAEIEQQLRYTTWWQFEEGYAVTRDDNQSVKVRSTDKPTITSYATLDLQDKGDATTNKFTVAQHGTYTFEIYAVTGEADKSDDSLLGDFNITVDGNPQPIVMSPNPDCRTLGWRRYCMLVVENVPMNEGAHTITVEAASGEGLSVDKFRMYREFNLQPSYKVEIVEYTPAEKLRMPQQVRVDIEAGVPKPLNPSLSILQILIGLGVIGMLALVYGWIKRVRQHAQPI